MKMKEECRKNCDGLKEKSDKGLRGQKIGWRNTRDEEGRNEDKWTLERFVMEMEEE